MKECLSENDPRIYNTGVQPSLEDDFSSDYPIDRVKKENKKIFLAIVNANALYPAE